MSRVMNTFGQNGVAGGTYLETQSDSIFAITRCSIWNYYVYDAHA